MVRLLASLMFCVAVFWGQAEDAPRFEVASIKRISGEQLHGLSGGQSRTGTLTMNNVTLKRCIMGAYAVGPNQIAGGPEWLDSDRFEIVAKAEQPVGDQVLMQMLRALLADRFRLQLHRETRTLEVYVLGVAKNGPKLKKSDKAQATTRGEHGAIDATKITMDRFAEVLSRQMDLPVVNQTGIEGVFDLALQWSPESTPTDNRPSIFTAVQEQLGLRLTAERAPIEVLVIDHAEPPSEN
jgi:uncharacterized protein (TIGR03435 family)